MSHPYQQGPQQVPQGWGYQAQPGVSGVPAHGGQVLGPGQPPTAVQPVPGSYPAGQAWAGQQGAAGPYAAAQRPVTTGPTAGLYPAGQPLVGQQGADGSYPTVAFAVGASTVPYPGGPSLVGQQAAGGPYRADQQPFAWAQAAQALPVQQDRPAPPKRLRYLRYCDGVYKLRSQRLISVVVGFVYLCVLGGAVSVLVNDGFTSNVLINVVVPVGLLLMILHFVSIELRSKSVFDPVARTVTFRRIGGTFTLAKTICSFDDFEGFERTRYTLYYILTVGTYLNAIFGGRKGGSLWAGTTYGPFFGKRRAEALSEEILAVMSL
ncbi:MAG: hypothetical protein FWD11_02795 [Micrococcales bacterium]|nr:hypothetical protein [Micrococcales bacterium]